MPAGAETMKFFAKSRFLDYKVFGALGPRDPGAQGPWGTGTLGPRDPGAQGPWGPGADFLKLAPGPILGPRGGQKWIPREISCRSHLFS